MQDLTTGAESETTRENTELRQTLEAMAERASKGDRIALYNLCEKLAGNVLFRTKYILGNENDAEDVSRDILLRICENIQSLREPRTFKAWLGGILTNETRRHISKSANSAAVASINECSVKAVEDIDPLPGEQEKKRAARKDVMEIVSKLPLRQREAVMLHYYDDLAVAEVAKAMSIPHQSVSRYLSLALKKLVIELKKEQNDLNDLNDPNALNVLNAPAALNALNAPTAPTAPNAGALALAPIGATLSSTFHAGAAEFVPSSMGWAQGALVQCQRQILMSISDTGDTAGSAAARMPFAAIVGSITSIIIAAVLALGIALGDKAHAPNEGQAPAPTAEGRIIFSGGETYRGSVRVNPKYAEPWVEGAEGDLRILKWWVTLAGRDTVLYEGEAGEVDEVFSMLRDSGMYGEYNMVFRFEDKAGVVYRLSSNFYIEQLPLDQDTESLAMLAPVM